MPVMRPFNLRALVVSCHFVDCNTLSVYRLQTQFIFTFISYIVGLNYCRVDVYLKFVWLSFVSVYN